MTTINTNTTNTAATANTNNMTIINLTPHEVNFVSADDKKILDVPASGMIARVCVQTSVVGTFNGIPVTQNLYGDVENLPEPQPGTIYIVSLPVAQRVPERDDVFLPNELVRDGSGVIKGCKSLGHI